MRRIASRIRLTIFKGGKMKKIFCICVVFLLTGCAVPTNNFTKQPIERALDLQAGQTEKQVLQIMGSPITREIQGRGVALQWCKTLQRDHFVIGFLYDGKLVGTRNYTNNQGYGDCTNFYKNIEWRPSDTVIEYRFR
jgi:hypothetical protein